MNEDLKYLVYVQNPHEEPRLLAAFALLHDAEYFVRYARKLSWKIEIVVKGE